MKIIPQSVELYKHNINPLEFIEKVGRVCYKSEDKIAPGTAEKMVVALKKSGHYSVLEHEWLYYWMNGEMHESFLMRFGEKCKYLNVVGTHYITGSIRAFIEFFESVDSSYSDSIDNEMMWMAHNELPMLFDKPENDAEFNGFGIKMVNREDVINDITLSGKHKIYHIPHTLKFVTNLGISHELVRHRPASFAQESSRYVDYNNDKNDHQLTFITPRIHETDILNYENWHYCMLMCETMYMNLRKGGIPAEDARGVLPKDCKTEIVVTASEAEWQHILNLRYHGTTGRPHPQMKELMGMALPILQEESNGRVE